MNTGHTFIALESLVRSYQNVCNDLTCERKAFYECEGDLCGNKICKLHAHRIGEKIFCEDCAKAVRDAD